MNTCCDRELIADMMWRSRFGDFEIALCEHHLTEYESAFDVDEATFVMREREPDYAQIVADRQADSKPWFADSPAWEGERR